MTLRTSIAIYVTAILAGGMIGWWTRDALITAIGAFVIGAGVRLLAEVCHVR
jgi:hypothetical protein